MAHLWFNLKEGGLAQYSQGLHTVQVRSSCNHILSLEGHSCRHRHTQTSPPAGACVLDKWVAALTSPERSSINPPSSLVRASLMTGSAFRSSNTAASDVSTKKRFLLSTSFTYRWVAWGTAAVVGKEFVTSF